MMNGEFSDVASIGMVSSQGSVLFSILIACFINDVCEQILYTIDLGSGGYFGSSS
jgi:hypothetical protein